MPEFSTDTTLRERTNVNAYWFWVLHGADRRFVIGGLVALVFCTFMAWGIAKPVSLRATMQTSDMVETVFAGLVGAIITSTTLVVSINQLVLSQEIGSLGTLQSRMNRAMDFREATDDLLGRTTPTDPARYLEALLETTEDRALALRDALADRDSDSSDAAGSALASDDQDRSYLVKDVDELLDDLLSKTAHARELLEGAKFGTFDVASASLDFDYDRKLHDIRLLVRRHQDDLGDAERVAFDDLAEALTMYGPVREYIKGLYIQWTLVQLSRAILYAAIVAITVAGGMVVFVDSTTFTGTFLGLDTVLWAVSTAFAVSTLPFLVFTAYVLRLATLAKQTLTVEPLILR